MAEGKENDVQFGNVALQFLFSEIKQREKNTNEESQKLDRLSAGLSSYFDSPFVLFALLSVPIVLGIKATCRRSQACAFSIART